jgi:hypothetical protein
MSRTTEHSDILSSFKLEFRSVDPEYSAERQYPEKRIRMQRSFS